MPTERPNAKGFAVQQSPQGLRPIDHFIIGVAVVALVAVAVVAARSGTAADPAARQAAEKAAAGVEDLKKQVKELREEVSAVRDLRKQLLALEDRVKESGGLNEAQIREAAKKAVDEELKGRQDQFAKDLDRRANETLNRIANDPKVPAMEQALKEAAERLRQVKAPEPPPAAPGATVAEKKPDPAQKADAGKKAEPKKTDPINDGIAKGAESIAEGLKLWRDFQQGKITQEEFDKRRKDLEQKVRQDFEKNLTPEQKAEMEKRMREWQNRGGGNPGGGNPAGGGGKEKEAGNF
jgi:outer membrane murein-binding lipoprotein Lpp